MPPSQIKPDVQALLAGTVKVRLPCAFSLKSPTNGRDPLQAAPSQPRTIKPEDSGDELGKPAATNVISIDINVSACQTLSFTHYVGFELPFAELM